MTFNIRLWTVPALLWAGLVVSGARAELLDAGVISLEGPYTRDAGPEDAVIDQADAGASLPGPIAEPLPAPIAESSPAASPAASEPMVEVEVRGRSRADELRRSALAIGVVELREARRTSADLGEVLSRVEGANVRRAGGLGSEQRFSLAGLEGDQIRFFLDGVPLELSGYPFGIANVPVNMLERVELYRGVVPIQLGADALGGAVNLVTGAPRAGTHGTASYQGGSYDTHRGTFDVSHRRDGWFARASAFMDYAKNDYPVDVTESNAMGVPYSVQVHRFHDAYRAGGGNLTVGVVDKPWADRLSLRGFITDYEKELQSDVQMETPYGEATSGGRTGGTSLTYHHAPSEKLSVEATAGYTYSVARLHDITRCTYDWFGICTPGELRSERGGLPQDSRLTQHAGFLRGSARYQLIRGHAATLSIAPTYYRRGGDDAYEVRPGARDPLDVDRRLSSMVAGVEYALSTLSDELALTAFGKGYFQWVRSEELLRDGETSVRRDRSTHRFGAGATSRYTIVEPLWVKLSYEYATRLPSADEVFGDGVQIDANLQLAPEVSHNGNVSLAGDHQSARAGRFTGEVTGFVRDADQLITMLGKDVSFAYVNVGHARALGGMASASWTMRGDYLNINGNATYQSFRNESDEGPYAPHKGDRMPNRPYLFANGSARGQVRDVFATRDTLSLGFTTRYTHGFFRSWESSGQRDTKMRIPSQLVYGLALTYLVQPARTRSFSSSLELQNLTNERVYDFYGVQKPGRTVFAKVVAEL